VVAHESPQPPQSLWLLEISTQPSPGQQTLLPVPHEVPAATCSHMAPAAQFPVLPQAAAVHWPDGAGMPARRGLHVPSTWPVSAMVQPMHCPVQAWLQHTPSTQKPLVQSPGAAHAWPVPEPLLLLLLLLLVALVVVETVELEPE